MDKLIYLDHSNSGNPTENPNWPEARVHHASRNRNQKTWSHHTRGAARSRIGEWDVILLFWSLLWTNPRKPFRSTLKWNHVFALDSYLSSFNSSSKLIFSLGTNLDNNGEFECRIEFKRVAVVFASSRNRKIRSIWGRYMINLMSSHLIPESLDYNLSAGKI